MSVVVGVTDLLGSNFDGLLDQVECPLEVVVFLRIIGGTGWLLLLAVL